MFTNLDLYTSTCLECSKITTLQYSTSFSKGIKNFHPSLHLPIYAIYGYVRFADEIVDTFHSTNQRELLSQFKKDTHLAIQEKLSINPILHSFQWVVNHFQIDYNLIDAFLFSMEMDLDKKSFSQQEYERYIYGSAEVIGLMCLKIFTHEQSEQYTALKPTAQALGSAFQKINFLRDFASDYFDRGRIYFPNCTFENWDNEKKKEIEKDIWKDFLKAKEGIYYLPKTARTGVLLAYNYYTELMRSVEQTSAEKIKRERVRVSDWKKSLILLNTKLLEFSK